MAKVYGKTSIRAMWTTARGLLALVIACGIVFGPSVAAPAHAEGLMLMEEPQPPSTGYAWLFVGLTLISYGVAANDYQESQYNITKAKDAYKKYVAATTATQALNYRQLTITYSNRAQSYESTTNAALIIGTLFALTAIATFRSDGSDSGPLLLSDRGITYRKTF
jgi:hypothetical protein